MLTYSKYCRSLVAALVLPVVLSACGGGGASTPAPAPAPAPAPGVPVVAAQADTVSGERNKAVTVSVLANDTVTNGGTLELDSVTVPAHGVAAKTGNTVLYTPAAGFFGKDSFSYTVKNAGAATSMTAEVTVNVVAPISLSGKVVDAPAGASASITVGSKVYEAPLNATGEFSAQLQLDTPASMVAIMAKGTGASAHVKLASLLGDSQTVADTAGALTAVTLNSMPGANVTVVSTAMHTMVTKLNSGVVPATQMALDTAAAKMNLNELFDRAVVIRALTGANGQPPVLAMPAGASDTLALLNDAKLYSQFHTQAQNASSRPLEPVKESLREDLRLTTIPPVVVDAVNPKRSLNFYGNEPCCAVLASEFVFDHTGLGSYLKQSTRVPALWSRNGDLTMTLGTPIKRADWISNDIPPSFGYEVEYQTKTVSLRQYTGGALQGVVALTEKGVIHYINGEKADQPFSVTRQALYSEWSRLAAPADPSGFLLGGIVDPFGPPAESTQQLLMSFAAGGTAASPQLANAAMLWKMENNRLAVDFNAGGKHSYAHVHTRDDGAERWLARVGNATGTDYTVQEMPVVKAQAGLSFTESNAASQWISVSSFGDAFQNFIISVGANQLGAEYNLFFDGTTATVRETSSTIENGQLVMRSYNVPNVFGSFATCPPNTACTVRSERRWTMLRNDAAGIWVYEQARYPRGEILNRINRYLRPMAP